MGDYRNMESITAISNAEGYRIILQNHFKESEKYPNKLLNMTLLPVIVISLLEIEMVFKAKLDEEGIPYPTNHNIAKLFKLLPQKSQDIISDNYNKCIQNAQRNKGCELLPFNDLVKQLDDNLFTKFRYLDAPSVKSISISLLDSISYFRYFLETLFKLPSVEMIGNFDYNPDEEKLKMDVEYLRCIWKNV
jgi:hypothetical protein